MGSVNFHSISVDRMILYICDYLWTAEGKKLIYLGVRNDARENKIETLQPFLATQ